MADTSLQVVVSPFLGVLFHNLTSLIQKQVGLLWGLDKEMTKLCSTLSTIRDVLEDAEEKQLANNAIVNWLRKIKDASYDADDILDEWATQVIQLQSATRSKQVCHSLLSCFNFKQMKFRYTIAKKIDSLTKRFDEIASERSKFHLRGLGSQERKNESYRSRDRESSSTVTEPQVYGRDEERDHLVQLLLNDVDSQEDISVHPILGIGGLGKTTVAQLVYNDQMVKEHFNVKIWVCVSEEFDIKKLTRAIVKSLTGDVSDYEDLDPLQRLLQENLDAKKFLLVLDDVWSEDQDQWNRFKYSLRCGARGSSIIVTTRLETVASITGTFPPYSLKYLSEDDCWSLFKQRAFGMGNEETPNLVEIGKEITKKCGGVPLAAKALGGLMRFKSHESDWNFVRDSEIWDLPSSNENTILPALRLSYIHLPTSMRHCFAFCSIFPKDYQMQKEEVIHLWMANGLVQSRERMQLEDIGNEIFDALWWRSFFQNVQKDEDGGILSCTMHDLFHDLACSITRNECSIVEARNAASIPRFTRHLSLISDLTKSSDKVEFAHQYSLFLRTILFINRSGAKMDVSFGFSSLNSVRALDLKFTKITTIPDSIANMKHLRYLNLSFTDITSLPDSICRLRNLQTLKLVMCHNLRSLPKDLRIMSSLRHLDIRQCDGLLQMPAGIGQLTCLQTLSIFIAGSDDGCQVKELQGLDHLRGELKIKGLEFVSSSTESKESNLMTRDKLRSLHLTWSDSHLQNGNEVDVVEGLQPHPNIKRLSIEGYEGLIFPRWLDVSCLPNLVKVSFSKCRRCEDLPVLSRSPLLKTLVMHSLDSVRIMDSGSMENGFTSLEELTLDDMPVFEEWSSSNGNRDGTVLPCLKKLNINNCPNLKRFPFSSFLEYLYLGSCSGTLLRSLENLPRLSSLTISNFSELSSFPENVLPSLTALQSLRILSCEKLRVLPNALTNLSSLNSFFISGCHELKSLPEFVADSLEYLSIKDCSSLAVIPGRLAYQTNLQDLVICGCPKLQFSMVNFQYLIVLRNLMIGDLAGLNELPEGIRYASALQHLEISRCGSLLSIPYWIGSLTKLSSLKISCCESLKVLPDGLRLLIKLQTLTIRNCDPDLHGRCKEKGGDWDKIEHIPNRLILLTPNRQFLP